MPNPIKAIKGGIQGVKNGAKSVKINNRIAKNPDLNPSAPKTKKTLGPINIAKSFIAGAKDPGEAKVQKGFLKSVSAAQKKKLSEKN